MNDSKTDTKEIFEEFNSKWHLDPRTRIIILFLILIATLYTENLFVLLCMLCFSLAAYFSSDSRLKPLLLVTLFITVFSALATIIAYYTNVISNPITTFIMIEIRFIVSLALFSWFFYSVSPYELAISLEKIYIPAKLIWLINAIYQFIPVLGKEAREINSVRKMKGLTGKWWKIRRQSYVMKKTLRPLVTSSINKAIDVTESMILKGFEPTRRKTYAFDVKIKFGDIITIIMIVTIFVLTIVFF